MKNLGEILANIARKLSHGENITFEDWGIDSIDTMIVVDNKRTYIDMYDLETLPDFAKEIDTNLIQTWGSRMVFKVRMTRKEFKERELEERKCKRQN